MSAGNLMGHVFVGAMFSAMWWIIGAQIQIVQIVFNKLTQILPTFQDAANGIALLNAIYALLPILFWILLWVNFASNEASEAGGYV